MATAPPPPLSATDKRLLQLIAQIILENVSSNPPISNVSHGCVALSDSEANELLKLVETLLENRAFLEKSHFIEDIAEHKDHNHAKKIFLAQRKRLGKSGTYSGSLWLSTLTRMGVIRSMEPYPIHVSPMSENQFLKMESQLFAATATDPRVANLALQVVSAQWKAVDKIRNGESSSLRPFSHAIQPLRKLLSASTGGTTISTRKLAAIWALIVNSGAMFYSRDWTVAGTFSSMASTIAATKD